MERITSSWQRRWLDAVVTALTAGSTVITVAALFLVLGYVLWRGAAAIDLRFLVAGPTPVGGGGGIGNAILGSFLMVGGGTLAALPIGIGAGIYLADFRAQPLARMVRSLVDSLAGVPSILVGVFVYLVLVVPLGRPSGLAGALALALIMLPIITRTTEEFALRVPQELRDGALALGAPQWRITLDIVLPAARTGILTGVLLAVARAAGETAPLLFTALGSRFFNLAPDQPMASLTVQIYHYATGPFASEHRLAWAAALVLISLVVLVNSTVRFLLRDRVAR